MINSLNNLKTGLTQTIEIRKVQQKEVKSIFLALKLNLVLNFIPFDTSIMMMTVLKIGPYR